MAQQRSCAAALLTSQASHASGQTLPPSPQDFCAGSFSCWQLCSLSSPRMCSAISRAPHDGSVPGGRRSVFALKFSARAP